MKKKKGLNDSPDSSTSGFRTISSRRDFLKSGVFAGAASVTAHQQTKEESPIQQSTEGVPVEPRADDVVLENQEFRLLISANGTARSLWHKKSGEDCLATGVSIPAFTATQYRPYENELQLRFPAKAKTYAANRVRREDNRLVIGFELIDHEVTLGVRITDSYMVFSVEKIVSGKVHEFRERRPTPLDELCILQLPIEERDNFGEWLNVMWDSEVAVSILAADPYPRIDSQSREGYQLMTASTLFDVKQEGVQAALIVGEGGDKILDSIAQLEVDYNLPNGVESRRQSNYSHSYYWVSDVTPANIDEHIEFALRGGFRTFMIYYTAFAQAPGHYLFRKEYPRGLEDLKEVVTKIQDAGMIPGLHHHYNKAFGNDPYITPKPDPRLNWRRTYTLASDLDPSATEVEVEENPEGSFPASVVKYLMIEDELLEYETYTTEHPFRFLGCQRGISGTQPKAHRSGLKLGLLGEVSGVIGVYDQQTGIQEEVARRLGKLYAEAGFKFAYFDGAEDVPPPYWFTVSWAQWLTWKEMVPKPLFSEGACKSHFSWHILSRGNAFDTYRPEDMKAATRKHPAEEASRIATDFTGLNFGWIGYWAPSDETIGTQPDMLEYVSSRAAAWDCPISFRGNLEGFSSHPRTPDNLEVLRRWEEVRIQRWLTEDHREQLRRLEQEHILLENQEGEFELWPYELIEGASGGDPRLRAFILERYETTWVVYWHTSGSGHLQLSLDEPELQVRVKLSDAPSQPEQRDGNWHLPVSSRRFLSCGSAQKDAVLRAFQQARFL